MSSILLVGLVSLIGRSIPAGQEFPVETIKPSAPA
jgi:hypothetical protein